MQVSKKDEQATCQNGRIVSCLLFAFTEKDLMQKAWQAPVLSRLDGKLTQGGGTQVGPEGSGYLGS